MFSSSRWLSLPLFLSPHLCHTISLLLPIQVSFFIKSFSFFWRRYRQRTRKHRNYVNVGLLKINFFNVHHTNRHFTLISLGWYFFMLASSIFFSLFLSFFIPFIYSYYPLFKCVAAPLSQTFSLSLTYGIFFKLFHLATIILYWNMSFTDTLTHYLFLLHSFYFSAFLCFTGCDLIILSALTVLLPLFLSLDTSFKILLSSVFLHLLLYPYLNLPLAIFCYCRLSVSTTIPYSLSLPFYPFLNIF